MVQTPVKPGDPARFAVIDAADGRRAMSWTVVTAKHTLDVFVMARCMGHIWKISLHESGDWHAGFTEAGAQRFIPQAETRHFRSWKQPAPFAPGFYRSVQIVAPDSELRALPFGVVESKSNKIIAIPAPGAGNVALIELVFAPIGDWEPTVLNIDAAFHIATLARADGSTVFVVAIQQPWVKEDHPRVAAQKAAAMANIPVAWWKGVKAPRCVAFGVQDDGTPYWLDLAADTPARTVADAGKSTSG
jgi:hypothetical protein